MCGSARSAAPGGSRETGYGACASCRRCRCLCGAACRRRRDRCQMSGASWPRALRAGLPASQCHYRPHCCYLIRMSRRRRCCCRNQMRMRPDADLCWCGGAWCAWGRAQGGGVSGAIEAAAAAAVGAVQECGRAPHKSTARLRCTLSAALRPRTPQHHHLNRRRLVVKRLCAPGGPQRHHLSRHRCCAAAVACLLSPRRRPRCRPQRGQVHRRQQPSWPLLVLVRASSALLANVVGLCGCAACVAQQPALRSLPPGPARRTLAAAEGVAAPLARLVAAARPHAAAARGHSTQQGLRGAQKRAFQA
jgi:hypothetical protein